MIFPRTTAIPFPHNDLRTLVRQETESMRGNTAWDKSLWASGGRRAPDRVCFWNSARHYVGQTWRKRGCGWGYGTLFARLPDELMLLTMIPLVIFAYGLKFLLLLSDPTCFAKTGTPSNERASNKSQRASNRNHSSLRSAFAIRPALRNGCKREYSV